MNKTSYKNHWIQVCTFPIDGVESGWTTVTTIGRHSTEDCVTISSTAAFRMEVMAIASAQWRAQDLIDERLRLEHEVPFAANV